MIYFNNVSKIYPDGTISLEDINFSVSSGEFVSVVGPSGAGKTTLVKLLLAEEKPTAGQVYFESTDIHYLRNSDLNQLRRRIGVVFQDFRLLPNKTAYENISFAMEAAGKSDEEMEVDIPQVLELVDLGNKLNHFPHQLSGGEKQRLAIARAIINQPDLIIADEPTGNLDPVNTYEVMEILRKINDMDTTILLTTHHRDVIAPLNSRVIQLEKGRILKE